MVARHDRQKVHHGRRKKGQKKRRKMWLQRNKLRFKNPRNRKSRRQFARRYLRHRRSKIGY